METSAKTIAVMLDDDATREVPNEEARRAMALAEAKEQEVIEDDAMAFDAVDEALAYLEAL